jgi:hypothetical protein
VKTTFAFQWAPAAQPSASALQRVFHLMGKQANIALEMIQVSFCFSRVTGKIKLSDIFVQCVFLL